MTPIRQGFARVYGVYPCTGGYAFALVEMRGRLVDWGKVNLGKNTDQEFEARVCQEVRRYAPAVIAVEDAENMRRSEGARRRVHIARETAGQFGVQSGEVSRQAVRD